ncbi:MAG: TolC family protein [Candidatus Margulisiibacteriota bacterium]|jgi:outer membrane protein
MKRLVAGFVSLLLLASFADALTLNDSIKIALDKNPQVVAAQEKLNAAGSKLGQAKSALFPRLKLEGAFGRNYQESPVPPNEAADLTTYTLSLSQPLFVISLPRLLTMADATFNGAKEDLRKAQSDVLYNTTNAYYSVLKAQKGFQVIDKTVQSLEKYVRLSKIYYDSGIIGRADVMRVETELLNTKVARIQAQSGLQLAIASLNSLLSENDVQETTVLDDSISANGANLPPLSELMTSALANRPDYRSFLEGEKIVKENIGLAAANYWPAFMLIGSSGKTIDLDSWRVLISGSWNIFDSFETPNKVAEAQANYNSVAAQKNQLSDGLELEVRSAYLEYQAAVEKVTAAQAAAELAQKTLQLNEVNYEQHITTFLSLLDARTAATRAETAVWSARYDLELAKAKINKAVGKTIF